MTTWALRLSFVFILLTFLASSFSTGGAVISTCNEAGLRAALATGEPVTFGCDGTIILSNSIAIANAATIDADGHTVALSGGGRTRIFEVSNGGSLRLIGLKLIDGFTEGAAGQEGSGGAIRVVQGELHATGCQFMNNTAAGGNGAPNGRGGRGRGGALYVSQGMLRLTNCAFLLNKVQGGAGGNTSGTSDVTGGDAGGAACATQDSDVSAIACQISGNDSLGGAVGTFPAFVGSGLPGGARGGAWQQVGGLSSFVDTSFNSNSAVAAVGGYNLAGGQGLGAGLFVESGTNTLEKVVFLGNLTRSGGSSRRGFAGLTGGGALFNGGTATLSLCRLEGNAVVTGDSGGNSRAAAGGGVNNTGTLILRDCIVERNIASMGKTGQPAASPPFLFGGAPQGGGLWNGGTAFLINSTFNSNHAFGMEPPARDPFFLSGWPAYGGAIYNSGLLSAINSTFVRNAAHGGDDQKFSHPFEYVLAGSGGHAYGGALYQAAGTTRLTNVTTALNEAIGGRGEYLGERFGDNFSITSPSTFSSINSIVAGSGASSNCVGVIIDQGHNISSDSSCHFSANGSLNETDPRLAPLALCGGPTPTMALLEGSPAIDAANPTACPPADQRGRTRPFGAGCDIGAFESSPPYTVLGYISGWVAPTADIHVLVNEVALPLGPENSYVLSDLAPGSYKIVPISPTAVFIQSNAVVTLGPDRLVNFYSYRSNAVTLEMNVAPGTNRVVVAGEEGRSYRLFGASALPGWIPLKTNLMPASGIFDYFEANLPAGSRLFKFESP